MNSIETLELLTQTETCKLLKISPRSLRRLRQQGKVRTTRIGQTLLYYKFIASKQHDVASVAQKMAVSVDTLYRYVRGDRPLPVDRIPDLVNATGDTEFLEYLTDKCGFSLVPKIKDKGTFKIFAQLVNVFQSAMNANEAAPSTQISGNFKPSDVVQRFLRRRQARQVDKDGMAGDA
jgi:hypothetical protein